MTDETFERFRRKLADVVTVAINSGKRVSASGSEGTYCPLGCHPDVGMYRPAGWRARYPFGIDVIAASEFMSGFDQGENNGRYSALGCLYRARFP